MNKIQKFISDNSLNFIGTGSGLNSNCTIISGYALHLGINNFTALQEELAGIALLPESNKELERVFNYAEANNYGAYWTSTDAKERYIF